MVPMGHVYAEDARLLPSSLKQCRDGLLAFFCVDILLTFFSGALINGKVVMQRSRVLSQYLMTWFILDIIATGPAILGALLHSSDDNETTLWHVWESLRLLRIFRVMRLQQCTHVVHAYFSLPGWLQVLYYMLKGNVILVFIAYAHAMVWATLQPPSWEATTLAGAFHNQIESLWWAYGALTWGQPQGESATASASASTRLIIFSTVVAMERVALFLVLVMWAVWRMLLTHDTHGDRALLHESMTSYLKRRHVPVETQLQLFAHLRESTRVRQMQHNLDQLAEESSRWTLRSNLCCELWGRHLLTFGLLYEVHTWHESFLGSLSMLVREMVLAPGDILYSHDTPSTHAYLVLRGCLVVTACHDVEIIPPYRAGHWVGEKALLNPDLPRHKTIVCRERAELLKVPGAEFRELVDRLKLTERFTQLLMETLWMGFCGRCGELGTHFAKECPKLGQPEMRMPLGFSESFSQQFRHAPKRSELDIANDGSNAGTPAHADLVAFLRSESLSDLLPPLQEKGVHHLSELTETVVEELKEQYSISEETLNKLRTGHIRRFKRRVAGITDGILKNNGGSGSFIFISHYKVEAGTEAALMQHDLERIMDTRNLKAPIFLDSDNLQDLRQLKKHVARSQNFVLLLTRHVLTRPWVLVEIVTAAKAGVQIVPVEVQRCDVGFRYPDNAYFERLVGGKELDESCTKLLGDQGIKLHEVDKALKQVFSHIAVPFSPHKSGTVREAELTDLLQHCQWQGCQ
eukprot:NODE_599_length_2896_cov_6.040087.p1 GENE.NODE_599_length_2896_cov_6.040087~~NODE_599_length_2896_cov_6.040087.p1  ORF type:complete len:820 (-),score=148.86 NODE_599_length_2896_cov_6.040087:435-2675(-)